MRSINARELRNEYAKVLAEVEAGESFTILSRGRAVA
ncbi:type II toxin-antitoxin system prevent-host-death family antitoxin, partial [Kineococcus sp. T13]|nr:type II toxin-antitoxin system prevent-host-death family antitoxin [Kineococcus vitellinus]